jgi:radical SAM protein (TIGR01212 family)
MLYNNLSGYLKTKYGAKVGKICIDGGFTCPNRDGKCGTGGCIFCSERGSGDHIDGARTIGEQVKATLKKGRYDKYIAYFQNYTNTYADLKTLKKRYDSALIDDRIVALAIGTRPDCIDEDVARLISEYKSRCDVWVELGLQTASDSIGKIINRGYTTDTFIKATEILKSFSIPFVVHMIIGLPESTEEDVYETVDLINKCGAWGVKIHSIYVSEGTALAQMYENNLYTPPTLDEFVSLAVGCITRLNPDVVIHRLTGDCPDGMLVAPEWNKDKNAILERIRTTLSETGARQGSLCE